MCWSSICNKIAIVGGCSSCTDVFDHELLYMRWCMFCGFGGKVLAVVLVTAAVIVGLMVMHITFYCDGADG